MKKIILFTILILLNINTIKAATVEYKIKSTGEYKNQMGTTINKENYNKIKNVITSEEIEYIDNNIYNKIQQSQKAVAYKLINLETNYITIGNDSFLLNKKIVSITESNSATLSSTIVDDIHTTEYKQVHLRVFLNNDGSHTFVLQNS